MNVGSNHIAEWSIISFLFIYKKKFKKIIWKAKEIIGFDDCNPTSKTSDLKLIHLHISYKAFC